jgi:Sap-like sulfolipid-1-addressing protein
LPGGDRPPPVRLAEEGGTDMLLLTLFLIGLAVALDPLPLTAFLIVLPSQRGTVKGAAFVFGWLVSLGAVVTITVLATGNSPPRPATVPSLAALAVKIVIGVVLVMIAVRHIRARGQPKPPKKPPKWQAHVDSMSPLFALALAPALQPWVLIGAGAATVVQAKLSSWESFLALFLYCVIASSSYLAMELYALFRPEQSQALLARFRTWIDTHTDQGIIVGSLLIGFWLIGNSIYLIVST